MKFLQLIILILLTTNLFGQNKQNKGVVYGKAIHFQLAKENDTINFIVADTVLNKKKPILLFCQGSMPIPLFIGFKNDFVFMYGGGISNFDNNLIKKNYHIIVISMPKTPLYSEKNHLNQSFCYLPDTTKNDVFSLEYLKADYLENYVLRANLVLDYLKEQKWVDSNKLVVAGHSQGSIVATSLTYSNKNITHLGLFAYNPNGRIDQIIRQERASVEKGLKTWEEANKEIDSWYNFWKDVNSPDIVKDNPDLISWKSFSEPTIHLLKAIEIPIYLTYGTEDITSDLCDLVPLEFIKNKKENLTISRKVGLDHNFFETDDDGNTEYNKPHWTTVMNDFIEWTLKINKK